MLLQRTQYPCQDCQTKWLVVTWIFRYRDIYTKGSAQRSRRHQKTRARADLVQVDHWRAGALQQMPALGSRRAGRGPRCLLCDLHICNPTSSSAFWSLGLYCAIITL
jgi:hypothetical protein